MAKVIKPKIKTPPPKKEEKKEPKIRHNISGAEPELDKP